MTVPTLAYRWSRDEFLRAWEAGAFDHRVELIEGKIWPAVIGDWHGKSAGRVIGTLFRFGEEVTAQTLPSGDSLPDPDCWVLRSGAQPSGRLGRRLSTWDPADVLLVVEVSDETVLQDLGIKARIYGAAGYPVYWVITRDVVYEHTAPTADGYRVRVEHRAGDRLRVPYADTDLAVTALLGR